MAEKLGEAVLELRTDSSKLDKGIDSAKGKASGLDAQFSKLGATMVAAFSAAALLSAIKRLGDQLIDFSKSAVEASISMEKVDNALSAVFGTQEAVGQEMEFLRDTADDLGLEFQSLTKDYASLAAASKGTVLAGEATRDIFLAVSEASVVMGLSADQTSGALLAIQQMISKGTVSAEELRGQLGERLPGAFQIAARAMNVTTAELGKMLQKGEITAEEMLPLLAAELRNTFGSQVQEASEATQRQLDRLKNAMFFLRLEAGKELAPAVGAVASALTELAKNEEAIAVVKQLAEVMIELALVLSKVVIGFGLFLETLGKVAGVVHFLPKEAAADFEAFGAAVKDAALEIALALDKIEEGAAKSAGSANELAAGLGGAADNATATGDNLARIPDLIAESEARLVALGEQHKANLQALEDQRDVMEAFLEMEQDLGLGVQEIAAEWDNVSDIVGDALLPSTEELTQLGHEFALLSGELPAIWKQVNAEIAQSGFWLDALNFSLNELLRGASFEEVFSQVGQQAGSALGEGIGFYLGGPAGAAVGEALGSVIGEAAGETIGGFLDGLFNSPSFKQKVRAFFDNFEGESATIGQVTKAINLLVKSIDKLGSETATQLLVDNFDEVVEAAIRLGGPAVDELAKLTAAIEESGVGADLLAEKLSEVMDEAARVLEERRAFILDQVDQILAGIDSMALKTAAAVEFAEQSVIVAFNAMVEAGVPLGEIALELADRFAAVEAAGGQAGSVFSETFGEIGDMLEILATEQVQKLVNGLENVAGVVEAVGNLGELSGEQFQFFTNRIKGTIEKLEETGLTGKQAFAAVQDELQLLMNLSEQYPELVGEGTKALLAEAEAMGVVASEGLSTNDILIKTYDLLLEALNRVIEALGGVPLLFDEIGATAEEVSTSVVEGQGDVQNSLIDVGEVGVQAYNEILEAARGSAEGSSEAWNTAIGEITKDLEGLAIKAKELFGENFIPPPGGGGGKGPPQFAHGSGGFRDFGSGTITNLHGVEQVITASEGTGIAQMVAVAIHHASRDNDEEARLLAQMVQFASLAHRQREDEKEGLAKIHSRLDRVPATPGPFQRLPGVVG